MCDCSKFSLLAVITEATKNSSQSYCIDFKVTLLYLGKTALPSILDYHYQYAKWMVSAWLDLIDNRSLTYSASRHHLHRY